MNNPLDASLRELNDCGCGAGVTAETPQLLTNRPGLTAVAYRAGTQPQFKASLLAALSSSAYPALRELRTRDDRDFTIGLLDAWACVADVLSFYSERIANEAFLRTATERRSVLELARAIGYELKPGVAAGTWIAFTVEDANGAPGYANIPAGTKIQSLPGPDEKPQTYETVETLRAEAFLNRVRLFGPPQPRNPFAAGSEGGEIVEGPTGLGRGSGLLLFDHEGWELKEVQTVEWIDGDPRLTWTPPANAARFGPFTTHLAPVTRRFRLFGHNAPERYPTPANTTATAGSTLTWVAGVISSYALGTPSRELSLDTRVDDLKPGTDVVLTGLTDPGTGAVRFARRTRVLETTVKGETFGSLADSVTSLTLGVAVAGIPAAQPDASGRLQVAVLADDGAAWMLRELEPGLRRFGSWRSLGGRITQLVLGRQADNRLILCAVGQDRALHVRVQSAPGVDQWTPWRSLGGQIEFLALESNRAGHLEVFARGTDRAVWRIAQTDALGQWTPWESLGGEIDLLAVGRNADGRIELFARGADGGLWQNWQTPAGTAWSGWHAQGGWIDRLAVGRNADGRLEVFARGQDGELWQRWQTAPNNGWSLWTRTGGQFDELAVGRNADGRLEVFVRGGDRALWHRWQTAPSNGWSGWNSLGGSIEMLGVGSNGDGCLQVLVRGLDNALWLRAQASPSNGWIPDWLSLHWPMWPISDRRQIVLHEQSAPSIELRLWRSAPQVEGDTAFARLEALSRLPLPRRAFLDDASKAPVLVSLVETQPVDADGDGRPELLRLRFSPPLARPLATASAWLQANVVPATHGESVTEVLGSGDATRAHQRFRLRRPPLTYVTGGADGTTSTLEVWVNDVRWKEVPTLFGRGPQERVYITRQQADGRTEVVFGDGLQGARLPSGQENVRATYRSGAGLEGLVKADQLSLLLTRPLGVRSVTNPSIPSGAAEAQSLTDARDNAPRTTLTLDRVVSIEDYIDFARDFPGVAKAHGVWVWIGEVRGVLLTVVGPGGLVLPPGEATVRELVRQLQRRGNERIPVRVLSAPPVRFGIQGTVRVAGDRVPGQVRAAVEGALSRGFGFATRDFGQGVALSEVIATIQSVPGVVMVDIDALTRPGLAAGVRQPLAYLGAATPPPGAASGTVEAAELLMGDERPLAGLTFESEVA